MTYKFYSYYYAHIPSDDESLELLFKVFIH
uniref:Uncharacterized protein n=2 Tax=unclassified bacterial viruses TaxID=12333 RepID=A0AAU8KY96_9VIRU